MQKVRAKKNLGQHFLKDQNIAADIANGFTSDAPNLILEIGPGMGILTRHLMRRPMPMFAWLKSTVNRWNT